MGDMSKTIAGKCGLTQRITLPANMCQRSRRPRVWRTLTRQSAGKSQAASTMPSFWKSTTIQQTSRSLSAAASTVWCLPRLWCETTICCPRTIKSKPPELRIWRMSRCTRRLLTIWQSASRLSSICLPSPGNLSTVLHVSSSRYQCTFSRPRRVPALAICPRSVFGSDQGSFARSLSD